VIGSQRGDMGGCVPTNSRMRRHFTCLGRGPV
jgi:hypothetical protein